jgi:hypothetical protein
LKLCLYTQNATKRVAVTFLYNFVLAAKMTFDISWYLLIKKTETDLTETVWGPENFKKINQLLRIDFFYKFFQLSLLRQLHSTPGKHEAQKKKTNKPRMKIFLLRQFINENLHFMYCISWCNSC